MTLTVRVEHRSPGYDKSVKVELVSIDFQGNHIRTNNPYDTHIIPPAKNAQEPNPYKDLMIYAGRDLIVSEVPNVEPPDPPKPDTA